jgi:hypothetical protein
VDGALDLAVTCGGPERFRILLGKGDGTFAANVTSYGQVSAPVAVVAADFNQDDKPDLAACNQQEQHDLPS